MSEHYPRIHIQTSHGHVLVREGLSLTFYMRRSHKEVAMAVERSLRTYLRAVGPDSLTVYVDEQGEWQDLDAAGWARIWRQLREDPWAGMDLDDTSSFAALYRFDYHGKDLQDPTRHDTQDATSAVSFWLPSTFLEEQGPSQVRELALELAAPLPFCSGHGGLSFNGDLSLSGVSERIASYCFRYPGLDIPDLAWRSWKLGTRVVGPHWLTFLGQPVLGELGGATALRSRLHSPDTTVQEMDGDRALITLGKWPEAGDTERGDNLPAYRELAHVLEPWLFHEPDGLSSGLPREEVRRWERRFLD